ncbi:unnamed protein product [Protopolystoma xenopodis]|uniref:Uncharacterized protein n=1 Tax=Protopolystoma xenopodis TaxID=117903 RepID=A0A3S4ZDZ6_9PLAT|nr:unnamed protein product [Protopolystoma xenopodis]
MLFFIVRVHSAVSLLTLFVRPFEDITFDIIEILNSSVAYMDQDPNVMPSFLVLDAALSVLVNPSLSLNSFPEDENFDLMVSGLSSGDAKHDGKSEFCLSGSQYRYQCLYLSALLFLYSLSSLINRICISFSFQNQLLRQRLDGVLTARFNPQLVTNLTNAWFRAGQLSQQLDMNKKLGICHDNAELCCFYQALSFKPSNKAESNELVSPISELRRAVHTFNNQLEQINEVFIDDYLTDHNQINSLSQLVNNLDKESLSTISFCQIQHNTDEHLCISSDLGQNSVSRRSAFKNIYD